MPLACAIGLSTCLVQQTAGLGLGVSWVWSTAIVGALCLFLRVFSLHVFSSPRYRHQPVARDAVFPQAQLRVEFDTGLSASTADDDDDDDAGNVMEKVDDVVGAVAPEVIAAVEPVAQQAVQAVENTRMCRVSR
jgi:hypothetical protein